MDGLVQVMLPIGYVTILRITHDDLGLMVMLMKRRCSVAKSTQIHEKSNVKVYRR